MSDALRICLIISLFFSFFQTPILYIIEGHLFAYTSIGISTTLVLILIQIILIAVLSSTKDDRILKIFIIIITS